MLSEVQKNKRLFLGAILLPFLFIGAIIAKSIVVSLISVGTAYYFFVSLILPFLSRNTNEQRLVPQRNEQASFADTTLQFLFSYNRKSTKEQIIDPETYNEISVIRGFTGKSKAQHDLRLFEQWYPQDIVQTLMYFQKNALNAVRVLFSDPNFIQELTQFKMLLNCLNKPGLFVAMEPGLGQNHFIFGMVYQNKLMLINPVGKTQHKDFYENIQKLIETKVFSDVLISDTKIQNDIQGLVSCGPICVELCQHFSQCDVENVFEVLSQNAQQSEKEKYKTVDISKQIPPGLVALKDSKVAAYQESVVKLRLAHLQQLLCVCQSKSSPNAINDLFEDALNNDAQILLRKMILGDITIVDLDETPEFIRLVADVKSSSQSKRKLN